MTAASATPAGAGQPGAGLQTDAVYCMDALELLRALPDGSVDAVITDPPYASGGFNEAEKRRSKGQGLRTETLAKTGWFINDSMGTSGLIWLLRTMALITKNKLKLGGSLLMFTDWRQLINLQPAIESAGFRYQNLLVWDKGSMGLGAGFRAQHELIMHFTLGTSADYYDRSIGNVISNGRIHVDDREHQTQKPVELIEPLIRVVSPHGGLIVDPFAGSGSVLVAARNLGRRYIGSDLSEEYCAVARRRLAEPFTPTLFIAPKEDAVTLPMLFADAAPEAG